MTAKVRDTVAVRPRLRECPRLSRVAGQSATTRRCQRHTDQERADHTSHHEAVAGHDSRPGASPTTSGLRGVTYVTVATVARERRATLAEAAAPAR